MLKPQASETRELVNLDGLYRFKVDFDRAGHQAEWFKAPLASPLEMGVPASDNDVFPDKAIRDHVGYVWYQRDVRVPRGWAGERIHLRLDSATHEGMVWVDDVHALFGRDVGDGTVDPLLGRKYRKEVECCANDHEHQGDGGKCCLQVGARLDQRSHENTQRGTNEHGADQPGGAEFGPVPRVLRHGAGQRAVRDVDQAVGQAQGRVRDVGVEQGAGFAQLRDRERGNAQQEQRDGAEHDERAELAEPLAEGAVHHPAGKNVSEGVEDPDRQQQGAGRGGGDARHVTEDGRRQQSYLHDFYNYAGLHRSLWLYSTPAVTVDDITVVTGFDGTTLKGNRPLLMLCLSSFFFLTGYLALSSVQLYYLRDVLHRLDLYPVLSIIQLALTLVLAAVMPKLVRRLGKKGVYVYASLVTVAGGAIIFLTPASQVWIGFAGLVVSLVGILPVNIVVWALEADTVEYGEWRTGVRTEGITYALFSFTRKTGHAVGGALAAYALALGGYKSGGEQTADAVFGIQFAAGALPAIMTILAVLVMSKYKLTDAVHAGILTEIQDRRKDAEGSGGTAAANASTPDAAALGSGGTTPPGPANH